jgi:hypothetical protein
MSRVPINLSLSSSLSAAEFGTGIFREKSRLPWRQRVCPSATLDKEARPKAAAYVKTSITNAPGVGNSFFQTALGLEPRWQVEYDVRRLGNSD